MILSIRSYEPEGYVCACGQKNWPGVACAKCGRPDPNRRGDDWVGR